MASVVIRSPAIDAAFCSAERTTFVGSMIPSVDETNGGSYNFGNGVGDYVSSSVIVETSTQFGNGTSDYLSAVVQALGNQIHFGDGNFDAVILGDNSDSSTITLGNGTGDSVTAETGSSNNTIIMGNGNTAPRC
jgi:hypothetical protein